MDKCNSPIGIRRSRTLPWLLPDAKAQVTIRYENDSPVAVEKVVLSTLHRKEISLNGVKEAVIREIILPALNHCS